MLISQLEVNGKLGFKFKFEKINILLGENKTGKSTFLKLLLYVLGSHVEDFVTEISKDKLCNNVMIDVAFKNSKNYRIIRKLPYSDTIIVIPLSGNGNTIDEELEAKSLDEFSEFIFEQEGYNTQTITYGTGKKATLRLYFLLRAIIVDQDTPATKILASLGGSDKEYVNNQDLIKKSIIESLIGKENSELQKIRLELQSIQDERRSINSKINLVKDLIEQEVKEDPNLKPDLDWVNKQIDKIISEKNSLANDKVNNLLKLKNFNNEKLNEEIKTKEVDKYQFSEALRALKLEIMDITDVSSSVKKELDDLKKMIVSRQILTQIPVKACPVCLESYELKPDTGELCPFCNKQIKYDDLENISRFKKMLDETIIEATQINLELTKKVAEKESCLNVIEKDLLLIKEKYLKEMSDFKHPIEEIINSLKIRMSDITNQEVKLKGFSKNLFLQKSLKKQKLELDVKLSELREVLDNLSIKSYKDIQILDVWRALFDKMLRYIYGDISNTYISDEDYMPQVDELNVKNVSSASLKVATRLAYILSLFNLKDQKNININHLGFVFFDSPKDKNLDTPKYKNLLRQVSSIETGQVFLTSSIDDKDLFDEIFDEGCFLRELYTDKKLLQKRIK